MIQILLAIAAAPVVLLALVSLFARKPDTLGAVDGRLPDCPSNPNCVCSQDSKSTHSVVPLRYAGEPTVAWARLQQILAAMPRATVVAAGDRYLHVEFRTRIFRFVDDAEFVLDPAAGAIHVRSAARSGYSDLGANRARIEVVRKQVD